MIIKDHSMHNTYYGEEEDLEEVRQKEKNKFVDLYNLRNKDVN